VVAAHGEDLGCLGLAHAVTLAQVDVDHDAHQPAAPSPPELRATARRR
jgi:hypothetical protein